MRWPEPLTTFRRAELSIADKLRQITWSMLFFVVLIGVFGFAMLYSAARSVDPWAMRQAIRFLFGCHSCRGCAGRYPRVLVTPI
jgi:cell division protein FtsW (lipid II flippase)